MDALINILHYSIGSIFLGIFFTLICIALMFLLIKSWWRDALFTPATYLVGFVLLVFLSFQSILMCGAFTIKSYCDDVETTINAIVADVPKNTMFSQQDSQAVLEHVSQEFPLVAYYINMADFSGHTPTNIAQSMVEELRAYMNYFILRRVGWSLLFVIAGAILAIKTISHQYQSAARRTGNSPTERISNRRRAPMGSRGGRRHR